MPPMNILHTHLSESFLLCKKLSFISRHGGLKKNKEARTPPIKYLHTHLSASHGCLKKSKRCKDTPSYCKQKINYRVLQSKTRL